MTSLIGASGKAGNKTPSGYSQGQRQIYTPDQVKLHQQMFQHAGPNSQLNRLAGGDQSAFAEMEAPALRQFSELQGGLASRFSQGGLGSRRTSGFQNESGQQASNFSQQLQSQRQDLQRQALQDLRGLSSELLEQRPYENYLVKKQRKPSFWQRLVGGAAPIAGGLAGGFFGGPQGAAAGYSLGGAFGKGVMGQEDQGGIDWSGISNLSNSWGNSGSNPNPYTNSNFRSEFERGM
jgi:hypothetical protein